MKKAGAPEVRDAWGTELRIGPSPWYGDKVHYVVRVSVLDKLFDSADDLAVGMEVRTSRVAPATNASYIACEFEHDRGPFNGLAQIVGTVADQTGAAVPEAKLEVVEVSSGKARHASANARGQFDLSGLPAGEYRIRVSMAGFRAASRAILLRERDRAVLSAILYVGAVTQAVDVRAVDAVRRHLQLRCPWRR